MNFLWLWRAICGSFLTLFLVWLPFFMTASIVYFENPPDLYIRLLYSVYTALARRRELPLKVMKMHTLRLWRWQKQRGVAFAHDHGAVIKFKEAGDYVCTREKKKTGKDNAAGIQDPSKRRQLSH